MRRPKTVASPKRQRRSTATITTVRITMGRTITASKMMKTLLRVKVMAMARRSLSPRRRKSASRGLKRPKPTRTRPRKRKRMRAMTSTMGMSTMAPRMTITVQSTTLRRTRRTRKSSPRHSRSRRSGQKRWPRRKGSVCRRPSPSEMLERKTQRRKTRGNRRSGRKRPR